MKDLISKWWNREWSSWEIEREYNSWRDFKNYIVLKRVSNDGLIQFKLIDRL
jgi:hypothetical protein